MAGQFLLTFVDFFFNLLTLLIVFRVLLSWFPNYRYHPLGELVYNLTDPVIAPIQRLVPNTGMLDFSPMIAIIVLLVLQQLLDYVVRAAFGFA